MIYCTLFILVLDTFMRLLEPLNEKNAQSLQELTSGLFGALAQADALPRRWHLDGRWGAVRTTHGDSNVRLLPLTQEAAVAVRNSMAGKPCHSRYLTPSVLEYLQKERILEVAKLKSSAASQPAHCFSLQL